MSERLLMSDGESVKSYCKRKGLKYNRVWSRIKEYGWTIDDAVSVSTSPSPVTIQYINGIPLPVACKKAGVSMPMVLQKQRLAGEPLIKSFNWCVRRKECLKTLKY